ncbi:MAG: PAS domain-containing protein [Bacteriovorax sp.]|nr:PAS domain-containing protein [Bacteriovorax sp.]
MSAQDDNLKIYTKYYQCFWKWNIKTGAIEWSDSIEPMFGLKKGEFGRTYESFLSYIHPEDREHVIEAVKLSLEIFCPYFVRHRVVWPNGEIHYVEESGEIVKDKDNKPSRMLGSIKNIDYYVYLETSNPLFRNKIYNPTILMDSLLKGVNQHSLVTITDVNGKIIYVNDKFCKISGYSFSEVIGHNHNITSSGLHDKTYWVNFWKTIKSGKVFNGIMVNRNKNGELYYVDTTIVPIFTETNEIYQYISMRTDVTHLQKLKMKTDVYSSELKVEVEFKEKKLRETQAQLIQSAKLAALGELSSGLAHELNNPLFLIQGFSANLKEKIEENHQAEGYADMIDDANEIYNNCIRMTNLIKHFREFTRLSSDDFVDVDIHSTIINSLHFFKEQFRLNEIHFELSLNAIEYYVAGVSNRLEQVLVNLLSNSRDSLLEKVMSERRLIHIKTISDGNNIKIIFSDNGIGIDSKNINKITDPFFTTKKVNQGTGLGLSIAHSIIDEVGGAIECKSIINEGAEFEITMPLKGR